MHEAIGEATLSNNFFKTVFLKKKDFSGEAELCQTVPMFPIPLLQLNGMVFTLKYKKCMEI